MALSAAAVAGAIPNTVWDCISSADADTTPLLITHNLNIVGLVPFVFFMPLLANAWISQWFVPVGTITANTITLSKTGAVGSGNAAAQVRVFILPYNFGRLTNVQ